jgi:hypothetical protein
MSWCEKVNAVKFSFDEVWRFHGRLEAEGQPPRDAQSVFDFSTRFFKGDRVRAVAFAMRMDAFVMLFSSDERIQAWTMPVQDDGSAALQEPVFHALAHCPLRLTAGTLRFNGDEFFDIVLRHAYQAGAA